MSTSQNTNPNVNFFDALGSKYEDAYGANEGQIAFVQDSLARLEANRGSDVPSFSPSSLSPKISILDIGVGTGKPAAYMAAERGMDVHGFDFAPAMVALARRNVPSGTFSLAHTLHFRTERVFDAAFAMFATFGLQRAEMAELVGRWARWIRPGGYVFVGTFKLEAFPPDTTVFESRDERYGAARVRRRFFGDVRSMLVFSEKGWERLLGEAGFEIVDARFAPFQPLADCDWEPHYFITARRV